MIVFRISFLLMLLVLRLRRAGSKSHDGKPMELFVACIREIERSRMKHRKIILRLLEVLDTV